MVLRNLLISIVSTDRRIAHKYFTTQGQGTGDLSIKDLVLPSGTTSDCIRACVVRGVLLLQEGYRDVLNDMHAELEQVLQRTNASLYDGGDMMATLLAAQEVNEWGSTLTQIVQCAAERRWSLPTLTGVPPTVRLRPVFQA